MLGRRKTGKEKEETIFFGGEEKGVKYLEKENVFFCGGDRNGEEKSRNGDTLGAVELIV